VHHRPISRFDDGPRFSIAPILALYEDLETVADVFDVDKRSVLRWQSDGISWALADDLACRAGFHPHTLWGKAWEDAAVATITAGDDAEIDAWCAGQPAGQLALL
jgi:hypothetical protein